MHQAFQRCSRRSHPRAAPFETDVVREHRPRLEASLVEVLEGAEVVVVGVGAIVQVRPLGPHGRVRRGVESAPVDVAEEGVGSGGRGVEASARIGLEKPRDEGPEVGVLDVEARRLRRLGRRLRSLRPVQR